MALSNAEQLILARASSAAVSAGIQRSSRNISRDRWLAAGNRYRVSTIKSIGDDFVAGRINSRQLAAYIAVSAPLHCCDGWAFLGRAIGSHLHGDPDSARHLAYYAELRATMALLASQGIGIFHNRHFIINGAGVAERLCNQGTHMAAWDSLEAWANLPRSGDLLGDILRPAGRSVRQWLDAMPSGASWQPIATQWLLKLGLDLQKMGNDRQARNEASYRPTQLNPAPCLTAEEAASAVVEMWQLLEPAASLSFDQVDRYLVRFTIEAAFLGTGGSTPRQAPKKFGAAVSAVVAANVSGTEAELWERFLKREALSDDPKILSLVKLSPTSAGRAVGQARHHLAVMARAMLLLRLASGATRKMLIDAGISFDDLSFWWHPYGTNRGLWRHPPSAMRLTDSWADTETQLSNIADWLDSGIPSSYYDFLANVPWSFAGLTNLELVGLWSLAS